jgi:GNAT superfamily N-acetyltransferase
MDIRPLTPAAVDDYLRFFDHDAFVDNPDWAACYCCCYQWAGSQDDWNCSTAAKNRALAKERIQSGAAHGLLAYDGDRVVGWVQAARIAELPSLTRFLEVASPQDTGAIACFVIAQTHRRRGLARHLLGAAIDHLRERGVEVVEAYPKKHAEGTAELFNGPLALYLEAGFEQVSEAKNGRLIVRKRVVRSG